MTIFFIYWQYQHTMYSRISSSSSTILDKLCYFQREKRLLSFITCNFKMFRCIKNIIAWKENFVWPSAYISEQKQKMNHWKIYDCTTISLFLFETFFHFQLLLKHFDSWRMLTNTLVKRNRLGKSRRIT